MLIIIIIIYFSIVYYSNKIVYPNIKDYDYIYKKELEQNLFNKNYINSFLNETIYINSKYGYKLHGILYKNKDNNKFVIFCHGITSAHTGSIKYLEMFLKRGYSVLIFDHRNHGKSDKNYTSFGYFEKYDAKSWIDYLYNNFNNPIIGVHGESMGASIALQLSSIDSRISFCIEDCGYSNIYDLFKYRTTHDYNNFFSLLTILTKFYIKYKYKWSFNDVSSDNYIDKIKCPIMFIHGELDLYVPTYMVYDLYNSYNGIKKIYIAKNAKHATSYNINPNLYKEKIYEFLDYIKYSQENSQL